MTEATIFPTLEIPETLAAGPGPGNTDRRVLTRFASAGVADHMQADVLRGMVEAKLMLREIWGTDQHVHTFGVAGTGWSGLDDHVQRRSAPGDKVVVFANGTFSGIDALTVRMKAATAKRSWPRIRPGPAGRVSVTVVVDIPHGQSVTAEVDGSRPGRAQAEMGRHGALGNRARAASTTCAASLTRASGMM